MTDGLDALEDSRRKRSEASSRGRRIPPSRHKPPAEPVEVKPEPDSTPAEPTAPAGAAPKPRKPRKPAPEPEPSARGPAAERLTKHTIHLGPSEDGFLEDVFIAGRRSSGGRVDANRSAVVRLALRRLAAEQSPDEIVDTIRSGTTRPATGRPRF